MLRLLQTFRKNLVSSLPLGHPLTFYCILRNLPELCQECYPGGCEGSSCYEKSRSFSVLRSPAASFLPSLSICEENLAFSGGSVASLSLSSVTSLKCFFLFLSVYLSTAAAFSICPSCDSSSVDFFPLPAPSLSPS